MGGNREDHMKLLSVVVIIALCLVHGTRSLQCLKCSDADKDNRKDLQCSETCQTGGKYCFSNTHPDGKDPIPRRACEYDTEKIKDWEKMDIIEKYNGFEKRSKTVSKGGKTWKYLLCNYDNYNDDPKPNGRITTEKPTTEKPDSSSSLASLSLPLLMCTVLASILPL